MNKADRFFQMKREGKPIAMLTAYDAPSARAQAAGHSTTDSADSLFAQSDVVSLHLRLVPATRGCVTPALVVVLPRPAE